ncbi:MAG: class I SAM-dependent methyltransferase [Pseudomonadota bacterium]|nr:class I SAM-dependent methyltransferase [Pseudomonadota bacterium]
MDSFPDAHKPGYAVYSRTSLAIYDALVLGLSNRWIWRCPSSHLVALYDQHVSANHLDIGVGTGYFLDKTRFPVSDPTVTLLDPNRECLDKAAARIARLNPVTVQADALVPWPKDIGSFKTIGLNYVLHCLPGTMTEKAVIFDHAVPHLEEGAAVFGSTILQGDGPRSGAARKLMQIYNRKGVFSNEADTQDTLRAELEKRFAEVTIERIGCVALFSARKLRLA